MDFETLFRQYPGLQNYYENIVQQGFQGTPQQALEEFITSTTGRKFPQAQEIGIQPPVTAPRITPELTQQLIRQQTGAATTQAEADALMRQYLPQTTRPQISPAQTQQLMAQTGAAATPAEITSMMQPPIAAYQRGLLSGSIAPSTPYGYGMATSPYYGYPRNPYGGLLY